MPKRKVSVAIRFVNPGSGKIKSVSANNFPASYEAPKPPIVKIVKFSPRDFRLGRIRNLFSIKAEIKRIHDTAMKDLNKLVLSIEAEIESLHKTNIERSPIEPTGQPNVGCGL